MVWTLLLRLRKTWALPAQPSLSFNQAKLNVQRRLVLKPDIPCLSCQAGLSQESGVAGFGLVQNADIIFTAARRQHAQLDACLAAGKFLRVQRIQSIYISGNLSRAEIGSPAHIRANSTPPFPYLELYSARAATILSRGGKSAGCDARLRAVQFGGQGGRLDKTTASVQTAIMIRDRVQQKPTSDGELWGRQSNFKLYG